MSTDSSQRSRIALSLIVVALSTGCATRQAATLDALCASPPPAVIQRITLSVDSVAASAPQFLREARGRQIDLTLSLHPGGDPLPPACHQRSGPASYDGTLPAGLATATAGASLGRWWVEGTNVLVDFNPRARDNNLILTLPLDGGDGTWSVSTIAGAIARGAVLTPEP